MNNSFRAMTLMLIAAFVVMGSSCPWDSDDDFVVQGPVADAGDDQITKVDHTVTLSGSGSDNVVYSWAQQSGPSVVTLDDPNSATPSFLARAAGSYEFSLTVTDGSDRSDMDTVTVTCHDIDGGEDHTVAVKPDGIVWAWGGNFDGQLGDGTGTKRNAPVPVCDVGETDCSANSLTNVVAVAAGRNHSLALKTDGTVLAWGANHVGQLGDGTTSRRFTPVPVCDVGETDCAANPLIDIIAISAGYLFSVALKSDGTMLAWGWNGSGELGIGSIVQSTTPVQVCAGGATFPCSDTNPLTDVVLMAGGGGGHTLALKSDGALWGWGHNKSGQVGRGAWSLEVLIPEQVCDTGQTAVCTEFISEVSAIDAWSGNSFALKSDGTLWGWGGNRYDQLGAVTVSVCNDDFGPGTACSEVPIPVCLSNDAPCTSAFDAVASFNSGRRFTVARRTDETVWSWGDNAESQLGHGTVDPASVAIPTQVCAPGQISPCSTFLSNVAAVATGSFHSLALLSDGTLWAWGDNDNGQLGNNDDTGTDSGVPVQVIGY